MRPCQNCGKPFLPKSKYNIRCKDPDCVRKYEADKSRKQYRRKHIDNWKPKSCKTCGVTFDPGPMRQAKIPNECLTCRGKNRRPLIEMTCYTCGAGFVGTRNHHYCQPICKLVGQKIRERIRKQQRRQNGLCPTHGTPGFCERCHTKDFYKNAKRKRGFVGSTVTALELAAAQKWVCSLCGGKLETRWAQGSHLSISIDHTVPRSQGGTDDPSNLTAAHLICNIRKSDKTLGPEQLRLVSPL